MIRSPASFATALLAVAACSSILACGRAAPDEGPAAVAREYLAARTWNERLQHVLAPEAVAAVLTSRGVDLAAALEPEDAGQAIEVRPADFGSLRVGEPAVVRTASRLVDPELKRGYGGIDEIYVFKTDAGFRIDDHATWGRNPITIRQLRDLGPDVSLNVRVLVKRDERFTTGYAADRISVNLAFPTETWIGASAERDSEAGRRLARLVEGGQPRKAVLGIRTAGHPGFLQLYVEKVLQEGWAFWDPTDAFMSQLAGPSQAAVDVGEVVVVKGQFTAERIRGNARMHVEEIRACYKQGLATNPGLRGEVLIRAQIRMSGEVLVAAVSQTVPGDPGVGKCLADTMMTWTFANPDNWKDSIADITFVLGR